MSRNLGPCQARTTARRLGLSSTRNTGYGRLAADNRQRLFDPTDRTDGYEKVVSETSGAVFSLPWFVAEDQGFFADEGIEMEFVDSLSVHVDQPVADPEKVDPILGHTPFEDNQVALYRA